MTYVYVFGGLAVAVAVAVVIVAALIEPLCADLFSHKGTDYGIGDPE